MDGIVEKTLLFDFYGDLLTDRQREIYENVVMNDMSLSEAAEEYGITRQGIHDMIRRCDHMLQEYEDRLHAVRQFDAIRGKVTELRGMLPEIRMENDDRDRLFRLSEEILEIL